MKNLFSAALLACSVSMTGMASAEPVKVGMITTLSGGGAGLGVDIRDGFMLAIKLSGSKDVEVVTADDAQKPENAVQLADKMIQQDNVDILTGIVWSNLLMAVQPGVVAQGKFYISPNAGPAPLAGKKCNALYFNAAYQNDNLHEAMGEYANQDHKKLFIMAPNYPAGKDSLTGFKRYYKGAVASEIYTQLGQTDYAAEIAQIRASGADGVFAFLPGGMGIAFMKQFP
jgi:branched-chain amino acid transport system substrate-binding protein